MRDYWPTQDWRAADPESLGLRSESLSDLDQAIRVRHRSINAFLVVRNGYLVFERYYNGNAQNDKHLVASVTKSVVSALVGIAIDRGAIKGVHQRVLDFFPDHVSGEHEHLKRQLTIEHLLTMTTGFQWRTGARTRELSIDRMRRSKDWVTFVLNLPIRERTFGTFQYNSGVTHLLSAILTRSTGSCAQDFATERLFDPIGIDGPKTHEHHSYCQADVFRNRGGSWPRDPQGNSIGGWGLALSAREMARFGYLYLNQGLWEGEQIISEKWVEDSIAFHTSGYGYQWWLQETNGILIFSAVGQGGNYIFCIPERDLVVVIASTVQPRWRDRWPLLTDYLLPAVQEDGEKGKSLE
jgi:CubicO group peptidase (beta-lactamase class C family)